MLEGREKGAHTHLLTKVDSLFHRVPPFKVDEDNYPLKQKLPLVRDEKEFRGTTQFAAPSHSGWTATLL